MELGEELELMNKSVTGDTVVEAEEPKVEEPKVEDPDAKVQGEEEGKEEEVAIEEPKVEAEEEVEPVIEPEVKEEVVEEPVIDERDKAIAELKAEIELLKARPKEEAKVEPEVIEPIDFLKDKDLDDLTRDPKEFNKLLNDIYQKASVDAGEKLLKNIPEVIKTQLQVQQELMNMADTFYKANEDLKPYKKNVALIFEELQSKNPDKSYEELMTSVATETRKKLGIKSIGQKKADPPPILPKKSSSAGKMETVKSQVKSLEDELDQMNKSLGR
jgi:hypothetical protein